MEYLEDPNKHRNKQNYFNGLIMVWSDKLYMEYLEDPNGTKMRNTALSKSF